MIWLLRFTALVAAFYLVRELVRWAWRNLFTESGARAQPQVRRGTVRRDPVCGTYVDVEVSVQAQEAGEALHFCSTQCRDVYQARQSAAAAH